MTTRITSDEAEVAASPPTADPGPGCTPASRVTRSLLAYGIVAGPSYVLVSLAQAATRKGFDLTRHDWSLLANGPGGWLQVANLVLTGLMVVAAAVGCSRSLRGGRGPVSYTHLTLPTICSV